MTDFDYEVKEKKKLAQMARSRVVRRGGCDLPCDKLTPAQLRKMNGSVSVYKIGQKITWAEFKSYPQDKQIEYLKWLGDNLGCNQKCFAEMMGVSTSRLSHYLKEKGLLGNLLGTKMRKENFIKYLDWLKSQEAPAVPEVEVPVVEVPVVEPKPVEMAYFPRVIQKGNLCFTGSAAEIAQTIYGIFRDVNLSVRIDFTVLSEEKVSSEDVVLPEVTVELSGRTNLNKATFEELRNLGFDAETTLNIIEGRPYNGIWELKKVAGVTKQQYFIVKEKIEV